MAIITDGTAFANHGIFVVETSANTGLHKWRNTMDVVWTPGSPPAYTDPVTTAFVTFLQFLQRDDSTITKVSLLPYVKGRQPLSAQGAIWEQVTSLACNNHDAGHAYPFNGNSGQPTVGELCLLLIKGKFTGGGGRVGRMFIRNSPPASDVTATAGGPPVFTTSALPNYPPAINSWINTKLAPYCEANPLPRFCLIHASNKGTPPGTHDIFESQMAIPVYQKLTMHDITSENKK